MKKLLLALLCALPLSAMQETPNQKLQRYGQYGAVASVLAHNTILVGITKGGCIALGPVFIAGVAVAAGTKYAYDTYKGNK